MSTDPTATDTEWDDLGYGPWKEVPLPREAPSESTRARLNLPRGLWPIDHEAAAQQPVFDPALTAYTRALRPSEPAFADPALAARWLAARREALETVLSAIADSPWAEHLVLRGSFLLRAWYGEEAREPGDLDFVVQPREWQLEDARTGTMLHDIAATAAAAAQDITAAESSPARVRLHADAAATDEIWTYSRVPGRRLVLPWSAEGVPGGAIQLDFTFTEILPAEPQHGLAPSRLLTAAPQLSLAWKILWLVSDSHPQGKDLYDALLLARSTEVPYELLRRVFELSDPSWQRYPLVPADIADLCVDWDEFHKDYPDLAEHCEDYPDRVEDDEDEEDDPDPAEDDGDDPDLAEEYPDRLLAALAPTFAGRSEYALRADWLAPVVAQYRQLLEEAGMDEVQRRMLGKPALRLVDSLVVTAELLGCDIGEAYRIASEPLADTDLRLNGLRQAADRLAAERR
ncbi:nucleotidyl transferase AbiEii/AbiGii toxin family protein [Kitasatospora sp. NPDC052896]|uniref:nucleotidyl transferase AbiEii/AbiGii toxin family protein n=1 Tax=Kitasatospora sp. NPDC052896 TaxID=3364061 RepID=UPI0037C6D933